ncbi:esterase [Kushneria sinocarnis]|uniref:Esterase n=1 Tax=Kushneria sinocarnis TaxID=595502 RepID=A0A420WYD6_9GAMM|nr:alpha/beta fold hydrolase [Kushneria sinocarnis]RKR06239.1 esterase [Kushneria sinocarnis]
MTLELHHTDTGGDGPILVILHGLFGSLDNWRSHIRVWQEQYRVIAMDLRNHGRSPHAEGMSYDAMAQDVLAVLDQLDIRECFLLGHSIGGKLAMTLARQQADRIAGLIVADIAPVAYEHGHDDIFRAMHAAEDAQPESRREADEAMTTAIGTPAIRQFLSTNLVRDEWGVLGWRVGLEQIEADYAALAAAPAGEAPYPGPALVLRGDRSDYVPDSTHEAIMAVLPHASIETLNGAGHWLHAEQPEAFRQAVDRFLKTAG